MNFRDLIYFLLILSLSILIISCGDRPSNVLGEKQMVSLLADMEIAEAYGNYQARTADEREKLGKKVLEAHGVSEETLDTTLAWYGKNMDLYSELFEKVDKEIIKRKKKLSDDTDITSFVSDNLWAYSEHLYISPLSGQEILSFNLPVNGIDGGEVLKFSFFMPNPVNLKGTLGVEYISGGGDLITTNYNSTRKKFQMELQTDTAQKVKRIFGTMQFKDLKQRPLYLDSVNLITEPFDSLKYKSNLRKQKQFKPLPE